MTEEREEYLDSLAERVNDIAQYEIEYYEDNTDNSVAEYVASIGYGDGEIRLYDLDDNIKSILKGLSKADQKELILKSADLYYSTNFYAVENSVFSCQVGERELELDSDINQELEALTEEEFNYVKLKSDYMLTRDYLVIDHGYGSWHLVVDPEQLEENASDYEKLPAIKLKTPDQWRSTFRLIVNQA